MKLFLSVLPVRIAAVRLKRAVYYGLSQNPRTVLEARSQPEGDRWVEARESDQQAAKRCSLLLAG